MWARASRISNAPHWRSSRPRLVLPTTCGPTPALDDRGCRTWNQGIEDEAAWLAGCLLISDGAAMAIAKGRWSTAEAQVRFGVSPQMVQFRLNATGAQTRTRRAYGL